MPERVPDSAEATDNKPSTRKEALNIKSPDTVEANGKDYHFAKPLVLVDVTNKDSIKAKYDGKDVAIVFTKQGPHLSFYVGGENNLEERYYLSLTHGSPNSGRESYDVVEIVDSRGELDKKMEGIRQKYGFDRVGITGDLVSEVGKSPKLVAAVTKKLASLDKVLSSMNPEWIKTNLAPVVLFSLDTVSLSTTYIKNKPAKTQISLSGDIDSLELVDSMIVVNEQKRRIVDAANELSAKLGVPVYYDDQMSKILNDSTTRDAASVLEGYADYKISQHAKIIEAVNRLPIELEIGIRKGYSIVITSNPPARGSGKVIYLETPGGKTTVDGIRAQIINQMVGRPE